FDCYTRVRAQGKYRLLILDGHSSHVTKAFIEYAHANKILLLIFPPHATHALQPLDVACYRPLAQHYSDELLHRGHTTEGWVPVAQADFFPLFWAAWKKTFTKDLVVQAFKCTRIHPLDANVVLKKFRNLTPKLPSTTLEPT
ncbi:DDE-domain-containing protein, partial [Didymella exigua CBS 183.55]